MSYSELKMRLLDSAIYSLERGATLLDILLQAYELGVRGHEERDNGQG